MGRQSQGVQAWSNYRFSPRSFIQASFRHQKVSQQFMPGGGTLTDVSLSANVLAPQRLKRVRLCSVRTLVISDHHSWSPDQRNDLLAAGFLAAVLEKVDGNR